MGKIIVALSTTLDGYADAENIIIDPAFFEFTQGLIKDAEVAAFGRNTFEFFQDRWPARLLDPATPNWIKEMAQVLNDIPKTVFSSTLKETSWQNSAIVGKLDRKYIAAFRKSNRGTMLTFGSLSLVEVLTEMNVVDEYYFNVQPMLPGKGSDRLFDKLKLGSAVKLKYIDCLTQSSGAHVIHYKNESVEVSS